MTVQPNCIQGKRWHQSSKATKLQTISPHRYDSTHAKYQLGSSSLQRRLNSGQTKIDWEHLELAQRINQRGILEIETKLGFCGTRVQVGRYAGEHQPDEKCPNCGQRELTEHLMLCPNQDRTRLLKEQTESLEGWLHKDDQNRNSQLTYWIPKVVCTNEISDFSMK